MYLRGGVNFLENGLTANLRAMHLDTEIMAVTNDNINGFDKIGYQRKAPVVSSFAEFMGVHALSTATDNTVGRLGMSDNPLDLALANKGYFQSVDKNGSVKLSRDGRFKLDNNGNLITLNNERVLANDGTTIKLPFLPEKLNDVKIDFDGNIRVINRKTNKQQYVSTLSVVTDNGVAVIEPNVRQGYNEFSNVSLATEFMEAVPVMRNFDANRILYQMQKSTLTKAIQQLGG